MKTNHEITIHEDEQVDIIFPDGSRVNVYFDGTMQISLTTNPDSISGDVWHNGTNTWSI